MFCISVQGYKACKIDATERCNPKFQIGEVIKVDDKWACKGRGDGNNGCVFFLITLSSRCELYTSCDQLRPTAIIGTTFVKQDTGIFSHSTGKLLVT